MTIRNLDSFIGALWDWKFLDDSCFPGTRITVGDLDGIVERNGEFLVIEAKGENVPLKPNSGQDILYRALAKKGFTVVYLNGEKNNTKYMTILNPCDTKWGERRVATNADVIAFISTWFQRANKKTRGTA